MKKRDITILSSAAVVVIVIAVFFIAPSSGRQFVSEISSKSTVNGSPFSSGNESALAAVKLVKAIDLSGVHGRIDHMSIDVVGKRLFIAELGNNSVDIINLTTGKHIHSISGLSEPQGILFVPNFNKIIISNGGDGTVKIYDGSSYSPISSLKLGDDADNIRYDNLTASVYVGYGGGALAVLNSNYSHIADIALSGHPEAFEISKNANKIFINIPSDHTIAVADKSVNKIVTKWDLGSQSDNFPMALDEKDHRLFVGFRDPSSLVVYDTESGKAITNLAISDDVDDVFYDNSTKQIYVSAGGGNIQIIKQNSPDNYTNVSSIDTAQGARTSLFVPDNHTLFVASPESLTKGAQILVYAVS